MKASSLALIFITLIFSVIPVFADEAALALLSRPDHFGLLRHALAPGTGDPKNFDVNRCSTQRNLSGAGKEQAHRIGVLLQKAGIREAEVYTSAWCRCKDTATLLNVGPVKVLSALNSFFLDYQRGPEQIKELRKWLAAQPLEKPTLLVTHQVVISGLTRVYPRSGELLIMRRKKNGRLETLDRVAID